jgi:hypothetical protein
MRNLRDFIKSFEGTGFEAEELKIFYRSVRKSVILGFFDKRAVWELFTLEDQCQWPLLQRIADPALPVYQNADKDLLDAFMKSIDDEKAIRAEKGRMETKKYWQALFGIIERRLEFFKAIFNFCNKDVRRCEIVAERYKRSRQNKIEDSKKLWKYGIGAGASALAGAAALWYLSRRARDSYRA